MGDNMGSYINELLKELNIDISYYEKNVLEKNSFLEELKKQIVKYSSIYDTSSELEKESIKHNLSRYYNLLYYINAKKNKERMYVLDGELQRIPNIFILDDKPTRFSIDESILANLDIEKGLSNDEALTLLRWVVNNARDNLDISNKSNNSNQRVYSNNDLSGACGLSQYLTLYPLQKLGLQVTINNVGDASIIRHAYGTVVIPINEDRQITEKRFLIDCTYRQFFLLKNNLISNYINNTPDIGFFVKESEEETRFAKELLSNGFTDGGKEALSLYLKPFYASSLTMDKVFKLDELFNELDILDIVLNKGEEFDYDEEEVVSFGMNIELPCASPKKK